MIGMNRLQTPDTDLFENRPINALVDTQSLKARLGELLQAEIGRSTAGQRSDDLHGSLEYLSHPEDHDSEGRDMGFDKRSFSRTELRVAASLPPQQVVKYLLYRYRFNHYPRHQLLSEFPILLAIEPTSICNLRCTMCFQVDEKLSKSRDNMGFMDFNLYKQIIDDATANDLCAIVLASRGEPTLHKDIFKMIRYAKDQGILDVKMNTNATRLTPDRSRELLESGLDTLVFSVDAAVKEDFERIRVGAKFEKVVENITTFNHIRTTEYPQAKTRTRISMVLVSAQQNVEHAIAFWEGLVDEFAYRWAIPRVKIYEQADITETRPCSLLWERMYIWWDGTVNPCDEDYLSYLSPGKLTTKSTLRDLWQSEQMQRYRQLHLHQLKNDLLPCHKCPGF